MDDRSPHSVPAWFKFVAILSILWSLIGCLIFLGEMFAQDSMTSAMTEPQKEWVRSTPPWIYVVFAIAVITGLAGSVLLLLRNSLSVGLFAISLIAVLVQMVYTMVIAGGLQVMGPSGAIMPGVVVGLAVLWLVLSVYSRGKGWLNA